MMLGSGQFDLFWSLERKVPWHTYRLSDEFKDLVWKMLTADPTKRIQAWKAQNHPWCKAERNCKDIKAFWYERFLQFAEEKAQELRSKDVDKAQFWEELV